jgi:two-component sensor histidine kinase
MHGLLSETGWQGAELREIIDGHLIVTDPSRIMKSGPPVQLDPQVALHVALMLHELGTNSVKYGALSKPGGIVKLDWSVNVGKLELHWAESGGPPVKAPLKRGFGTILIEQTVRGEGGHSEMQIEAEGLRWDITIPIQSEKETLRIVPTRDRWYGLRPSGVPSRKRLPHLSSTSAFWSSRTNR